MLLITAANPRWKNENGDETTRRSSVIPLSISKFHPSRVENISRLDEIFSFIIIIIFVHLLIYFSSSPYSLEIIFYAIRKCRPLNKEREVLPAGDFAIHTHCTPVTGNAR